MTTNAFVLAVAWSGFLVHGLIGILVARHGATARLVPGLNLVISALVLAYWAQRWSGYLFRGTKWYLSDQLVPAYALAIGVVAALALWGRHPGVVLNWVIFTINGLTLLGAALLFAFLRFDRLW